jgi:hypothetical protein
MEEEAGGEQSQIRSMASFGAMFRGSRGGQGEVAHDPFPTTAGKKRDAFPTTKKRRPEEKQEGRQTDDDDDDDEQEEVQGIPIQRRDHRRPDKAGKYTLPILTTHDEKFDAAVVDDSAISSRLIKPAQPFSGLDSLHAEER